MVIHAVLLMNKSNDLQYLYPFVCFHVVQVLRQVLLVSKAAAFSVAVDANETLDAFDQWDDDAVVFVHRGGSFEITLVVYRRRYLAGLCDSVGLLLYTTTF